MRVNGDMMRLKNVNILILILDFIVILNLLIPLGFFLGSPEEAGAIGIIGGVDGPTAIFITSSIISHIPIFTFIILNIVILILNIKVLLSKRK